ncbi:MAG: DUF4401 domain-containing protein [Planctomycetes bacterium]|nr:DUF4401 domain-containing protein [Planctomycetota bacterium]
MTDRDPSYGDVLRHLADRGLLDPARTADLHALLARREAAPDQPWYVSALAGAGAWVAGFCLVLFLHEVGAIARWEAAQLLPWGIGFLIAATALRRRARSVFLVQLALAASVVGHVLVLGGVAELTRRSHGHVFDSAEPTGALAAAAVLLAAAHYPLNRDPLHRFLSVLNAAVFVVVWVFDARLHVPLYLLLLLEAAGVAFLFTWHRTSADLRSLAYALATAFVLTHVVWISRLELGAPEWPARIVSALWLLWILHWSAGGRSLLRHEPLLVAGAAAVLLAVVAPPGLLAAIGLLVLGHALGERVLVGLGVVFVPAYLIVYYTELELGLDRKAYLLMASGLILLAARWVLGRRPWAREEEAA